MTKRQFEAAKQMITAKCDEIRAKKNAELAARGLRIVLRKDLRTGDVAVNQNLPDQMLYTVADVQPAQARGYLVVTGTLDGQPTRTSGHALDEIWCRR